MNILLVLDSLSDHCGANVNIARTITKQFRRRGYKIYVLTKSDCRRTISEKISQEFDNVTSIKTDSIEILPNLKINPNLDCSKSRQMIWLINHPGIFLTAIDRIILGAYFTKKVFALEISRLCKRFNIDAVLGIAAPYYIAEAIVKANVNAIKAVYQLDPYTNNYTLSVLAKPLRKHIERKTINKLDLLFLTDFVKKDIVDQEISNDKSKMVEANIPGIIVDNITENFTSNKEKSKDEFIHFYFAGKFYRKIRNPEYLLELFCHLPNNYILDIAGAGCEDIISSYKDRLGDRLIHHGFLSKHDADQYVEKADILINVDNTIRNQMPSKIVEYICQGVKILNVCKDKECLSSKLLADYPNGITIFEDRESMENNVECLEIFVEKDIKPMTLEQILRIYRKYTDQYVADTIANKLENAVKK